MSKSNPNALIGLDNKEELRAIEYGSNQLNNTTNLSHSNLIYSLLLLSFIFFCFGLSACKSSDDAEGSNLPEAEKINHYKHHGTATVKCRSCNTYPWPTFTVYEKSFAPDKGRRKYICNVCNCAIFSPPITDFKILDNPDLQKEWWPPTNQYSGDRKKWDPCTNVNLNNEGGFCNCETYTVQLHRTNPNWYRVECGRSGALSNPCSMVYYLVSPDLKDIE